MDRAKEPTKARFDVGEYDDGSGPVATVSYDATAGATASMIWVETSSDQWIAFDWQHADELCAAIQRCAAMLRALAQPAFMGDATDLGVLTAVGLRIFLSMFERTPA